MTAIDSYLKALQISTRCKHTRAKVQKRRDKATLRDSTHTDLHVCKLTSVMTVHPPKHT